MKVLEADATPELRFWVDYSDGALENTFYRRYYDSREEAERAVERMERDGEVGNIEIRQEERDRKASHVIIVNNGDGEPRVYGRWFTARTANKAARRYAKRHPGIGTIRVVKLLGQLR